MRKLVYSENEIKRQGNIYKKRSYLKKFLAIGLISGLVLMSGCTNSKTVK